MFDFDNAKRVIASVAGAAILSATCVLTAVAPARAAEIGQAGQHAPGAIVAELAVSSFARS